MFSGIRGFAVGVAVAAAVAAGAVRGAPPSGPGVLVPPKADILSVEIQRRPMQTVAYFGAGIRAPHQTPAGPEEAERVAVEWFAHSPGIPPGAVLMLETVSERQPTVKNRIQRLSAKSEGNLSALFDIPAEETLAAGGIGQWRVRVIWRGRVLASRASAGWGSAQRGKP